MKIPLAIASAVLLGGVLTACGGSDGGGADGGNGGKGSDYCKDLKESAKSFEGLNAGDASTIGDTFTRFHKLADEAPGAIKDDWKTLDEAVAAIEKALEDAGVKLEDLGKVVSGEQLEGVDKAKLAKLPAALQKFSGAEFKDASSAIEKHAKSVCEIDLNAALG